MKEVSCRATSILLEAAEASGIAPERLVRDLPVTIEALRDPKNRIGWDMFVALCDNLEAICGRGVELDRVSVRMVRVPSFDLVRRLAASFVRPVRLYEAGVRWVSPLLFPVLTVSLESRERSRCTITAEIPSSYRDSSSFFRFCRGSLSEVSTLLDLPPATVEPEIGSHRARYVITLAPPRSIVGRVERVVRSLAGERTFVDELAAQQAELRTSYQALLRSRHDFRSVLETIPELVLIHKDGQIRWANRTFAAAVGLPSADAARGRLLIDFMHPDDHPRAEERLRQPVTVEVGDEAPMDALRLVRADGGVVMLEVGPAREVEFEGEPTRLVVARDVTERRRMLEQLMLSDRMASLGTLAAGVAHEINNPIAYIYLNLEAALRELGRPGEPPDEEALERVREALDVAREGTERVRTIVRDLRAFSRSDEELVGAVPVTEVIDSTLELASHEIRHKARVEKDYEPVPPVRANRGRLGQVILNLLLNAADAMSSDMRGGEHVIRIGTRLGADGRVVIEVSDNGEGIPRHLLGRVFDPFFTTKGAGTGLGLSICRSIVTRLGGEIAVDSEEGRGTTFRVALPAEETD